MIRILIFAGISFVVGLGGSSAVVVQRAGAAHAEAADSTGHGAGTDSAAIGLPDAAHEVDSIAAAAEQADTLAGHAAGDTAAAGEHPVEPAGVEPAAVESVPAKQVQPASGPDPLETARKEGAKRLAKIFGAMKPEEAARVLERLEDGEIEPILLELGDRKAAAVLGSFEPERAARLASKVMQPAGTR